MRVPWKLIGVAGLAGVAATDPEELRERLNRRLADVDTGGEGTGARVGDPAARERSGQ